MSGHYDAVVIGAGMSGLAAAIRVAMSGKRVLVVEKHEAPGGLNSYFFKERRYFDVGLHAMTNYVPPGSRGAPLTKLLRQLRIRHEDLGLSEQAGSRIVFPGAALDFANGPERLTDSIAAGFPGAVDRFRLLLREVRETDPFSISTPSASGRAFLIDRLGDADLAEMLLCPLFYYGSSREDDIDLDQLLILFNALYLEGFARPFGGIRDLLKLLQRRLKELGGERRMRCGVERIETREGRARGVVLEDGSHLEADWVFSSAGRLETDRLLGDERNERDPQCGRLGFTETLTVLNREPADLGVDATIVFFCTGSRIAYRDPGERVDLRSGVVCSPNNYLYGEGKKLPEGIFRVTGLASYQSWKELDRDAYRSAKDEAYPQILDNALRSAYPSVDPEAFHRARIADDMFTPLTVERFTGHIGGAIYGSPDKVRDGRYRFENLILTGTDQGFLGITGAMLSGISMANRYAVQS